MYTKSPKKVIEDDDDHSHLFMQYVESDNRKQNYLVESDNRQQNYLNKAKLNFFQPQQQEIQQPEEHDEKRQILQEYYRKQAFLNFRKSNHSLNANEVSDGVKVVYQQPTQSQSIQPIQSSMRKGKSKKKTVQINEDKNLVHFFIKATEESLTIQEKTALMERIQMHRYGMISYDENEDDVIDQEDQFMEDLQDEEPKSTHDWHKQTQIDFLESVDQEQDQEQDQEDDLIITKDNLEQFRNKRTFLFQKEKQQDKQQEQNTHHKKQQTNKKLTKHKEKEHEDLYGRKALDMMKKMGYQGRGLGREEQGIMNPVQAVMKTSLEGRTHEDLDIDYDQTDQTIKSVNDKSKLHKKMDKIWKKKNKNNRKRDEVVIKEKDQDDSVQNLSRGANLRKVQMGQGLSLEGMKVLDMSKAGTIVYDNIENYLNKTDEEEIKLDKVYISPLESYKEGLDQLSNMGMSLQNRVDKLYNKISRIEGNIKSENDKLIMFQFEYNQKNEQKMKDINKISRLQEFLLELQSIQDTNLKRYREVFIEYGDEYVQFNVQNLYLKDLGENINENIRHWEGPHDSNPESQLQALQKQISQFIEVTKEVFSHNRMMKMKQYTENLRTNQNIFRNQCIKITNADMRIIRRYIGYLMKPILNKLRSHIINQWVPDEENDCYLLDFIEIWTKTITVFEIDETDMKEYSSCISRDMELEIIDHLLLPKLHKSIENYRNKETNLLHTWLLPWYIYIQSKDDNRLQDLNKVIVAKISQTLQDWQPSQSWGFHFLSPWRNYMDAKKWESILLRVVVPKLLHMMNTQFSINPSDQDITSIKVILQWSDFLTNEHISILLDQSLFEQMQVILDRWKCNGGDKEEIKQWFNGWQEILKRIICRVPSFQGLMNSMKFKI